MGVGIGKMGVQEKEDETTRAGDGALTSGCMCARRPEGTRAGRPPTEAIRRTRSRSLTSTVIVIACQLIMNIGGESSQCSKDADLWFSDGSIVLRADNTLFKVYSGILAQASPVFKDMFTFPQHPSNDDETYEGLLVVHIPDSAVDLKPFLKAIHDSR